MPGTYLVWGIYDPHYCIYFGLIVYWCNLYHYVDNKICNWMKNFNITAKLVKDFKKIYVFDACTSAVVLVTVCTLHVSSGSPVLTISCSACSVCHKIHITVQCCWSLLLEALNIHHKGQGLCSADWQPCSYLRWPWPTVTLYFICFFCCKLLCHFISLMEHSYLLIQDSTKKLRGVLKCRLQLFSTQ